MRSWLFTACLFLNVSAVAQEAGKVDFQQGEVKVLDAKGVVRTPRTGETLFVGEILQTGNDGEVHLAMRDGGELGLHANTQMRIEQYKAEGGSDDTSVFRLLKGAMRSVTGWIGKYNSRNYAIRTPTATIGVRGTDHETWVVPEGSKEGDPGTYDKVNVGATEMKTAYGTTQIRPNQAGFVGFGQRRKPAVLDRLPAFFRPMRSEQRFAGLHEKIRERADHLRQERVKESAAIRQEQRKAIDERRREKGKEKGKDAKLERQKFREHGAQVRGENGRASRRDKVQKQKGHGSRQARESGGAWTGKARNQREDFAGHLPKNGNRERFDQGVRSGLERQGGRGRGGHRGD